MYTENTPSYTRTHTYAHTAVMYTSRSLVYTAISVRCGPILVVFRVPFFVHSYFTFFFLPATVATTGAGVCVGPAPQSPRYGNAARI